jgi:hypothetical protein
MKRCKERDKGIERERRRDGRREMKGQQESEEGM